MEKTNQEHKQLTLWIVTASSSKQQQPLRTGYDVVTAIYAYNQTDAKEKSRSWLTKYPEKPYHSFMECPTGFCVGIQTWLPGYIQEEASHKKTT
jgi:hypothetical protein